LQADQRAERQAGQVLDVAEIEEQVRLAWFIGQGEKLATDAGERFLIQRCFVAGEVNHSHVTARICVPGCGLKL
jgi:hypothetical protein